MPQATITNANILDAISSFVQMISERFDAVDERFDGVERRLDHVEQRLDLVEHDVAELRQVSYRQEQNFGKTIALLERAHSVT